MRWTGMLFFLRGAKEAEVEDLDDFIGLKFLLRAGFIYRVNVGFFQLGVLGVSLLRGVANWLHAKTAPLPATHLTPFPLEHPASEVRPLFWYTSSVLQIAQKVIHSYKQLPQYLVTFGPVYRNERRVRGGLFRTYAFHVIEAQTLAKNLSEAHEAQKFWMNAWQDLLRHARIDTVIARRPDRMGNVGYSHIWLDSKADTTFLHCPQCDTWLHPEVAPFMHHLQVTPPLLPLQRVLTPHATTVKALCEQLRIEPHQVAKSMFLMIDDRIPAIGVVRGDRELSWSKLKRIVGTVNIRPATPEEMETLGAKAGYASPIGIQRALVVVDPEIMLGSNWVAGANETHYHFINVNPGRDFQPHIIADIVRAPLNSTCPQCGNSYETRKAWTLASVTFPLHPPQQLLIPPPDFMSSLKDVSPAFPVPSYLNQHGRREVPWLVRATLGFERLIGAVAETHHDAMGLRWPFEFSPLDVHLVALLGRTKDEVLATAESIYAQLQEARVRVLYDDRNERAGVKLKDADLIGAPIRVVVSARTLEHGTVEISARDGSSQLTPLSEVVDTVLRMLRSEI